MWATLTADGRVAGLYSREAVARLNAGEAAIAPAPAEVVAAPAAWRLRDGVWAPAEDTAAEAEPADPIVMRRRAYGEQLDVDVQLEAIVEFLAGSPGKFEALLTRIAEIKAAHPKPPAA